MELRKMLRIMVRIPGGSRIKGTSLSKIITDECSKEGILGATIMQALFGYGEKEYRPHLLRGVGELPQIVEIIDEPAMLRQFLPKLKQIVGDQGLITLEEIYVV